MELAVASGLKVLQLKLEAHRTAICGLGTSSRRSAASTLGIDTTGWDGSTENAARVVRVIVALAYKQADVATAHRLLHDLGFGATAPGSLPSAETSVREGLDETLTVLTPARSLRAFAD